MHDPDFSLISQFIANFSPTVTGRSTPLSDDLRKRILQFARGELKGTERSAAAIEILQNSSAVKLLAEEIRAAA